MGTVTSGGMAPPCNLCNAHYDMVNCKVVHEKDCPATILEKPVTDVLSPDFEIIEAQKSGEDICGRTPLQKLADTLNEAVRMVAELPEDKSDVEVSGSFGFYVDGYTMASTENIGEIKLTGYDGRTTIVKSAALVAWIERRLEPKPD